MSAQSPEVPERRREAQQEPVIRLALSPLERSPEVVVLTIEVVEQPPLLGAQDSAPRVLCKLQEPPGVPTLEISGLAGTGEPCERELTNRLEEEEALVFGLAEKALVNERRERSSPASQTASAAPRSKLPAKTAGGEEVLLVLVEQS